MNNINEYNLSSKFSIKPKPKNEKTSIFYNLFNNTSAADLKAFRMMGR